MNCKPGDLAIIIRGRGLSGRIVEVVAPCPQNVSFRLPDGAMHDPCTYEWIVRFQNPVEARMRVGELIGTRTTNYAPAPDSALRPITGLPIDEEITDEVTA